MPDTGRIEQIVEKFGPRIKKFKLWCSIQFETSEISEKQLMVALKCLPRVENLTFRNFFVRTSALEAEDLNLHKLTKLLVDYCLFDTPTILNSIPPDVLRDLVFTFESQDESRFQNFFNRQSKIKKLEMFENEKICFDHLQLEHLKISSSVDFVKMLTNQPKLRYLDFAISWIDDRVFAAICELKHLEVLRTLIDQVSCREFKNLSKLTRLKEIRMDSHSSFDYGHLLEFSMMRFSALEKLTLLYTEQMIPHQILIQLSQSFPNLKHIEGNNRSIKIIGVVLENFPNLESILFDFFSIFGVPEDILAFSDDLVHENIKQLVITNVNILENDNTKAILNLVNACPNLERIMLPMLSGFSFENFQEIVNRHAHLTHLSLEFEDFELNYDAIDVILTSKKLIHLRLKGLHAYPRYVTLRTLFEDKFCNITLYDYSNQQAELVMKKRNVPDWHLNFRLMDHF